MKKSKKNAAAPDKSSKSSKSAKAALGKSVKSAQTEQSTIKAGSTPNILSARLREASFILVLAVAGFWLLALFSYHAADFGWSYSGHTQQVANSAGVAGAWLSDISLYFFGYLAFLLPLIVCYSGWHFCLCKRSGRSSWVTQLCRVIGLIFMLLASAALVNLFVPRSVQALPFSSGGVIGYVVSQQMRVWFNYSGAVLLLYAAVLFGVTLLFGLSWLQLAENLGRLLVKSLRAVFKFGSTACSKMREVLRRSIAQAIAQARRAKSSSTVSIVDDPKLHTTKKTPSVLTAVNNAPAIARPSSGPSVEERLAQLKSSTKKQQEARHGAKVQPQPGQGPTLELLDEHIIPEGQGLSQEQIELQSRDVEVKLAEFGVKAEVVAVLPGPVVTRYEIALAAGTKASKISALSKDLARSLSVLSVRVVEVIPGKSVIGIELPNVNRAIVSLQEVFATEVFENSTSTLTLALGKDIAGRAVAVDLAKMPHLLVAGTTGSGKSVGLNAMLLSLLYKSTPQQLRIILIDPKMLELAIYEDIPHLLVPVVTDMKEAANALRWCVVEMERRYRLMAALGVRNIAGFNQKVADAIASGEPLLDPMQEQPTDGTPAATLEELPKIVIIADEFADMMMVVGKKIETLIARLAQKARAAGIHLIFATQRPSVDVITGLIKANIPTRIAFQVSSRIDSRTILDQQGAEHLLGHGDMLYLAPGTGIPKRVHGAYVSDEEVHRVVNYLKASAKPNYLNEILDDQQMQNAAKSDPVLASMQGGDSNDNQHDQLFDQAVEFIAQARRASISSVQRRFKIGYNRAARIIEQMEAEGMLGAMESNGAREVLLPEPRRD